MMNLLLLTLLLLQDAGKQADEKPTTHLAAIQIAKAALETGNLKQLSTVTAGPSGVAFRKMVEPLLNCQAAITKFNSTLSEQPNLQVANPFSGMLQLVEPQVFELLEQVKEKDGVMVRARVGPRKRPREESLHLVSEEGQWRMTLPSDLSKSLERLATPGKVDKQIAALNKLSEVFKQLQSELEKKQFSSKEQLLIRMTQLIDEAKL